MGSISPHRDHTFSRLATVRHTHNKCFNLPFFTFLSSSFLFSLFFPTYFPTFISFLCSQLLDGAGNIYTLTQISYNGTWQWRYNLTTPSSTDPIRAPSHYHSLALPWQTDTPPTTPWMLDAYGAQDQTERNFGWEAVRTLDEDIEVSFCAADSSLQTTSTTSTTPSCT